MHFSWKFIGAPNGDFSPIITIAKHRSHFEWQRLSHDIMPYDFWLSYYLKPKAYVGEVSNLSILKDNKSQTVQNTHVTFTHDHGEWCAQSARCFFWEWCSYWMWFNSLPGKWMQWITIHNFAVRLYVLLLFFCNTFHAVQRYEYP